uniref:ATP synthase complex subunit 8 n=1 Tax=Chthonerpeton indistinctum TaxID=420416 RepID=W5RHI6_CHTIN|nr:ATP synthase F0 subunit 8 [Chthonerpeton indistinctum]AGZ18929.1 ATP synthase F0 subunit 8 [Chthonerpeton indistinctum]
MPQLNPNPWLWTALISWSILLMMLTKLTSYKLTNKVNINFEDLTTTLLTPWTWPW